MRPEDLTLSTALPADAPAAGRRLTQSHRRRTQAVLVGLALVTALAIMPTIYALVAFHGATRPLTKPDVASRLALNGLANFCVMIWAMRASGRLDQRLTEVLAVALVVHGALAFFTLVTRSFYSIPMMTLAGLASCALGWTMIFARSRLLRPQVGIVGPWHPIFADPNLDCRRLTAEASELHDVDLVLVTEEDDAAVASNSLLLRALLLGKRVRHVAEFMEEGRGACEIGLFDIDAVSFAGVTRYRHAKRALDLLLVFVTLPITLPLTLLGALAVFASMGRPVVFVQPRIGRAGRLFSMFKLRTMRIAAPDESMATAPGDARITPVGRFLRRFRIDELPQLFNVLRGDMSVVGPRPEWAPLAERYAAEEPKYLLRQLVRPGLTGWAQVRAEPASDIAETRIKLGYDFFYLKHISLGLDLQILWRTAWTLIHGGGAR